MNFLVDFYSRTCILSHEMVTTTEHNQGGYWEIYHFSSLKKNRCLIDIYQSFAASVKAQVYSYMLNPLVVQLNKVLNRFGIQIFKNAYPPAA